MTRKEKMETRELGSYTKETALLTRLPPIEVQLDGAARQVFDEAQTYCAEWEYLVERAMEDMTETEERWKFIKQQSDEVKSWDESKKAELGSYMENRTLNCIGTKDLVKSLSTEELEAEVRRRKAEERAQKESKQREWRRNVLNNIDALLSIVAFHSMPDCDDTYNTNTNCTRCRLLELKATGDVDTYFNLNIYFGF